MDLKKFTFQFTLCSELVVETCFSSLKGIRIICQSLPLRINKKKQPPCLNLTLHQQRVAIVKPIQRLGRILSSPKLKDPEIQVPTQKLAVGISKPDFGEKATTYGYGFAVLLWDHLRLYAIGDVYDQPIRATRNVNKILFRRPTGLRNSKSNSNKPAYALYVSLNRGGL